jgi:EpsI family protein
MTPTLIRSLVVAACMLAATAYLSRTSRAETLPPREPLATVPMQIDQWKGRREPDFTPEVIAVAGVDDYITRTYFTDDSAIGLYVGYYASQRQGDTVHSPLNCLPGSGWLPMEVGRATINVSETVGGPATRPIEVNRVVIAKGLDKQLVLYWYQSHNRVIASEYWGRIYTVLDSVKYNRTDAALVRVIVPLTDDVPVATSEASGVAFVRALFPRLLGSLPS